jgi:DNA-binding CsgD family transcriptional regulator
MPCSSKQERSIGGMISWARPRRCTIDIPKGPGPEGTSGLSSTLADWPLVGRVSEVDFLERGLRAASAGMVISGDLGVGKTRLASTVADQLAGDGWSVSRHVASEARVGIPFSAFGALFEDAGDARNPLQRLLDAAERLEAGDRPVLLQIDDGHWLDDESTAFVQQIAESAEATVLLTVRSGHPRAGRVLEAARKMGLRRLEVLPLSRAEVAELLRGLIPDIRPGEVHHLWALTQGNPLYLHEIVARSLEQGGQLRAGEGWVVGALDHVDLAGVVGDRLDDVDAGQQEVLELLAVAPGAPLDLLYRCAGDEAVVDLQRRHLVAVVESGHRLVAMLAHPVYAELMTARMGAATQLLRQRQVQAEVERHGALRGSDLLQSALWATDHGEDVGPEQLLAAARRLTGLADRVGEGSHHAAYAVRGGLRASVGRLAKAAFDAGGGFEAADTWFQAEAHQDGFSGATAEALESMRGSVATDEHRSRLQAREVGLEMFLGRSPVNDVIDDFDELHRAAGDAEASRSIDVFRLMAMFLQGDAEGAVVLGREMLDDPATSRPDRLATASGLVSSLAFTGRTEEALHTAEQLVGEIRPDDEQFGTGTLHAARVITLSFAGRGHEAEELAARLTAVSEATGNERGVALFGTAQAQCALFAGRATDALAFATAALHAVPEAEDTGLVGWRRPAHAAAAFAYALLGLRDDAAAALVRMEASPGANLTFPVIEVQANAWVAVRAGRRRAAIDVLRAGIEAGISGVAGRMTFLHELVRLGERGIGAEMQAVLDGGADGELYEVFAAHGAAFDADDGVLLEAATADVERLGHILSAAEAAAQAATAHAMAGDRAAAVASRERSARLAGACPGVTTPALEVKTSALRDLAPRELEVARQAARGATNREIALDLGISVRTIETYLYRAFFKLGIDSRDDLRSHPEL